MIKACKIFHKHMRTRMAQRLTVSVCVCVYAQLHICIGYVSTQCVCVWVIYRKKNRDNMERREMSGGQESGEWKAEKKMN